MSSVSRCMHTPCSLLKVPGEGKFQSSELRSFVMVAHRTHVGAIYLTRYEVWNLILKLRHSRLTLFIVPTKHGGRTEETIIFLTL
jgi:hypothetical protein